MGFDAIAMYGLSTIGGLGGGMVAAGMGAIAGLCFLVLGLVISMVWLAGLSSTFFAIVTESSEGHDVIQQWPPPNVAEWFPELVYYLIAITVSGVPGWAIAHFTTNEPLIATLATAGGMILAFPLIILSQLDGGSAFSVVSPRIFQSLFLCPFSWLMFYVETAFLVGISVTMGAFLPSLAVTPVLVMSVILYAAGCLAGLAGGWRNRWELPSNNRTLERAMKSSALRSERRAVHRLLHGRVPASIEDIASNPRIALDAA